MFSHINNRLCIARLYLELRKGKGKYISLKRIRYKQFETKIHIIKHCM